jgi:hypothetical protein
MKKSGFQSLGFQLPILLVLILTIFGLEADAIPISWPTYTYASDSDIDPTDPIVDPDNPLDQWEPFAPFNTTKEWIWIGAPNRHYPDLTKVGVFIIDYLCIKPLEVVSGKAGYFDYLGPVDAFYDDSASTHSGSVGQLIIKFVVNPQPDFEWFKLHNDPELVTFTDVSCTTNCIPEPSTLVLVGIGMLGVIGYVFRRKRRCDS